MIFSKIINYKIKSEEINLIISETIIESASTTYFKLNSSLDIDFRDGFWKNTSLRFFLINDFTSQYSLTNILQITQTLHKQKFIDSNTLEKVTRQIDR